MTENLLPHGYAFPEVAGSAWVAPRAVVVGDVRLGEEASVWYGAVLRGDTELTPRSEPAPTSRTAACCTPTPATVGRPSARTAWSATRL
jgi:hypothetical protein